MIDVSTFGDRPETTQLFDGTVDQKTFKKAISENRLIKMRSKSHSSSIRVGEVEPMTKKRSRFFRISMIHGSQLLRKNHSERLSRGDIGETVKQLIGGSLFLTISGELSVNFEQNEGIE
jgi:hypothetical protein